MKRIITFVFLFVLIFNMTACSSEDTSSDSDSETAVSIIQALPFPDIRLQIPADYEITSSEYIDEFYKKGNASVIATSKAISSSTDMDGIVYDVLLQYNNTVDTLNEVSNESLTINGCDARIIEITYSIIGTENILNTSCCLGVITTETSMYLITCSSPSDEYHQYVDEFKNIIKSAEPASK